MEEKERKQEKEVYISTRIDAETNQMLIKAAKESRRSKHNELAIRVKEHLKKFPPQDI
ncbi:TraY domain-containing protein [Legionella israelensis]|uniref:TraY domain-containing protein n=1 Tax=Legionella israelensis TaxID=454 RepID=UPI00163D8CFC|nr:TraY domain-containing protein [Legionella israelensis]